MIRGCTEAVRILLDRGADAAVRTPQDRTLYEIAEEKGYEQIAGLLKRHGIGT